MFNLFVEFWINPSPLMYAHSSEFYIHVHSRLILEVLQCLYIAYISILDSGDACCTPIYNWIVQLRYKLVLGLALSNARTAAVVVFRWWLVFLANAAKHKTRAIIICAVYFICVLYERNVYVWWRSIAPRVAIYWYNRSAKVVSIVLYIIAGIDIHSYLLCFIFRAIRFCI